MTELEAYGLIVLCSLVTALIVWAITWRHRHWTPLPEHTAYIRGFSAAERVYDRMEVQDRKERLLRR